MRHKYGQDVALINEQMEALKKVRTSLVESESCSRRSLYLTAFITLFFYPFMACPPLILNRHFACKVICLVQYKRGSFVHVISYVLPHSHLPTAFVLQLNSLRKTLPHRLVRCINQSPPQGILVS